MKRILAIVLAVITLLTVVACGVPSVSAADTVTLSYAFSGDEANKAGFAEGTISLKLNDTSAAGNYYLYWADSTKALDGYRYIATLNVTSGTGTYKMLDHTAIPPQATQIIAIKSSSVPTNKNVSNASGTYAIPTAKRLSASNAIYSFGAFSDPQIANDSYGESRYPHDETHWAKALETYANRNVDFLVSSGDIVNDQNGGQTYAAEYKRYQKLLADSSYVNPVWECNGNHDVHVKWQHNVSNVLNEPFVKGTGLDSKAETIKANKAYFEITEPTTGDHFIFMAQEGGFYTDEVEQFSDAQLAWLEGLLKKYHGDGKNIFVLEHANVENWGSGDKYPSPYYDLGMLTSQSSTAKFIKLMETYKECVIITGHTHLELSAHLNYSDNNGTSAVMMHNSAIGGVRRLLNGSVNRDPVLGLCEGYIVDVYNDCVIFNGTNLYHDEIMPDCTYIIPNSTSALPTEAPTQAPTQAPTVVPSSDDTKVLYGDADLDGFVNITDATYIQKYVARYVEFTPEEYKNAAVAGENEITIIDATLVQQHVARIIDKFPVETMNSKAVAAVGADDIATLLATAKKELSGNYQYSSYDQYQALKKYVNELEKTSDTSATAYSKLETLYNELVAIISATGGSSSGNTGDTINVYFTNIPNWSKVCAYVWNGSTNNSSWPGDTMDYVGTNSQGQKIYKITLETGKYQNIIFSNGSGSQTVDLDLAATDNQGFYTTTQTNGKYNCETYTYTG